jgi:hypothetical protein
MEVRVGKKLATKKMVKGQQPKTFNCRIVLVNVR